jgi:hypothetical protein
MLPEDDGYSSTFIVILQMGWLRPILMKFRGNCFSKESITESRLKEILSLTEINTFNNSFKKSLGGIVYDYDLGNIKYTITFYPERD